MDRERLHMAVVWSRASACCLSGLRGQGAGAGVCVCALFEHPLGFESVW